MSRSESFALPRPVAEEILKRYGDVLRVGSIRVNGESLTWHTDTSMELQLRSFSENFFARLRLLLPHLAALDPGVLRFATYWFCKAVSINYALIEVVLLLKRKVGVLCTIETREDYGPGLVEYCVDIRPGQRMKVSLKWRKGDNIIYCNPETASKQVKGSLTQLETEFLLPPETGFAPSYSLQMRLRKSLAAKFASRVACAGSLQRISPAETVFLDEPLRSEFPLETFQELASRSPRSSTNWSRPSSYRSCGSVSSHGDRLPGGPPRPTAQVFSGLGTDGSRGSGGSGNSRPVVGTCEGEALAEHIRGPWAGRLRIRVVRARGLVQSCPSIRCEPYARCTIAGTTECTRKVVTDLSGPVWLETLDFRLGEQDLYGEVLVEVYAELFDSRQRYKEHDFLGRAIVPVSGLLVDGGKVSVTERLDDVERGEIELELELLPDFGAALVASSAPDIGDSKAEEDLCTVAVGPNFANKGRAPPATVRPRRQAVGEAAPPAGLISGLKVHARAASESSTLGLWCSRACTTEKG